MAVPSPFDDLTHDEHLTALTHVATRALSRYGLADVVPVLHKASQNILFRVQPLGQQRPPALGGAGRGGPEGFALRVHAPGYHSTPEIYEELQWLVALRRDTTLVVPTPVPACDGSLVQEIGGLGDPSLWQCVLLHWVPGTFRDDTLTPAALHGVGAFMAQLHSHAERFVAACTSRPTRSALFCEVATWRPALHHAATVFSPAELAVFTVAAEWVHTTVQALGETRDVYGFIHADLHQANYLFQGDTIGAIDFDDCGWGYYAYDMAVTLSSLEKRPAFPALEEAFLTGYHRVRPLPRRYAACRAVFRAARLLVIVLWILSWPSPASQAWGPAYLQEAVVRLRHFLEHEP